MQYKLIFSCLAFLFFSAFTLKEKTVTIFLIGDSTMADRSTASGSPERGWGQMLPCFLNGRIRVENHAACGRSSLSFIREGRWQAVLDRLQAGDYVIIQFGHNDEKTDTALHTVPGGSFDENLRRFVRETREKGAHPVLMNSIVRRNYPPTPETPHQYIYEKEGNTLVDTHGEYLLSPRRIAHEMDVPFVDMAKLTHDQVAEMGPELSKKLFMWIPPGRYPSLPQGKVDNTHLNIWGSKVFAAIAAKALSQKVPRLSKYIRHIDPQTVQDTETTCFGQSTGTVIVNGIPWFDDRGGIVNAHGACIVEEDGRYYLFGEWKSDKSNAFPGFSCYSSDDLVNWKFENVVLRVQPDGILGPNRVGERVKVMKCPKTGEYVMFMHADDMGYKDPYIGYATCKTIDGDYQLQGPLLYQGKPVKRWDMGTFQDSDGRGYLLIHHGPVYRLSDDYHSVETEVAHVKGAGESPAMFKKEGIYYLLYSNLTSWEKNDNFYFTAPRIEGPWTRRGLFCPEGRLTYNSQTTFVFPLRHGNDTVPMFMGDRWSYPRQASAATYVWMPLQAEGTKLSMPEYWQAWDMRTLRPTDALKGGKMLPSGKIRCPAHWRREDGALVSDTPDSKMEMEFEGTHAAIIGESGPLGGYARVSVLDSQRDTVYSSLVDYYSKYPETAIRIITPCKPRGKYTLCVEVTGISPVWTDKSKRIYGSKGCRIGIRQACIFEE